MLTIKLIFNETKQKYFFKIEKNIQEIRIKIGVDVKHFLFFKKNKSESKK